MTKGNLEKKKIYILLTFLIITIVLLTVFSIECYLVKYQAKQKILLPYHAANKKLEEVTCQ